MKTITTLIKVTIRSLIFRNSSPSSECRLDLWDNFRWYWWKGAAAGCTDISVHLMFIPIWMIFLCFMSLSFPASGLQLVIRHVSMIIGWFRSDRTPLNSIVHLSRVFSSSSHSKQMHGCIALLVSGWIILRIARAKQYGRLKVWNLFLKLAKCFVFNRTVAFALQNLYEIAL